MTKPAQETSVALVAKVVKAYSLFLGVEGHNGTEVMRVTTSVTSQALALGKVEARELSGFVLDPRCCIGLL